MSHVYGTIDWLVDELREAVADLEADGFPEGSPEAKLIVGMRAALASYDGVDETDGPIVVPEETP